jgi:hypothetical protein
MDMAAARAIIRQRVKRRFIPFSDQSGLRMYGNEVIDFAISGLRSM